MLCFVDVDKPKSDIALKKTQKKGNEKMHKFPSSVWILVILVASFSTASKNDASSILNLNICGGSSNDEAVNLFLKRFKCYINICDELSTEYGYEELWIETNMELQLHFDNFQNCSKQSMEMLVHA